MKRQKWMKLISASVGTPGCSCTLVCAPLPFSRATSCVLGLREGQGKGLTTALREMLCGGFGSVRDHS